MNYPTLLLVIVCALAAPAAATASQGQSLPVVTVRVVEGGEAAAKAADVRRVVVGPGVNEPDPFPGFGGSVAWAGIARSKREIGRAHV